MGLFLTFSGRRDVIIPHIVPLFSSHRRIRTQRPFTSRNKQVAEECIIRKPHIRFSASQMAEIRSIFEYCHSFDRAIQRATQNPQALFDYVEEERPYANFWADALDRLSIKINLKKKPEPAFHKADQRLSWRTIPSASLTDWCCAR